MNPAVAPEPSVSPPFDARQVYADLSRLAENPGPGLQADQALLAYLCAMTNSQAGFYFRCRSDSRLECRAATGGKDSREHRLNFEKAIAEEWEERRNTPKAFLFTETAGNTEFKFLVSPVLQSGRVRGLICLVLITGENDDLSPFLLILQTATGFFNLAHQGAELSTANQWALQKTAALVEVTEKAASFDDFDEACLNLVNELQNYFGCYRVALGVRNRSGIQPVAVSHIVDFDSKSTSSQALEAAMRECAKLDRPIRLPEEGDDAPDIIQVAAHREVLRILDLGAVQSFPLHRPDGTPCGVLVLMWGPDRPPSQQHDTLVDASLPPLSGLFHLLYRTRPNPAQKYLIQRWKKWGKRKKHLILYGAIALIALLFIPSFPYHITAPCTLEPLERRVIAAPFDCRLERAVVEPGQPVAEGDLLARLDGKELRSQLAELVARRDRAAKQADQAMASGDVPAFQVAQLEAESLKFEIEILSERTRNLEIRSPIDGILIAGDLERAEGVPLEKGEVLFEVGPLGDLIAEIAIPEDRISHIREQMPVRIKVNAFAGEKWASQIDTLHPRSETRDRKNVFIAEAYLENPAEKLKPGMQGKASVETGGRSLAWILFHRLWEFLQIKLFW